MTYLINSNHMEFIVDFLLCDNSTYFFLKCPFMEEGEEISFCLEQNGVVQILAVK